VHIRYHTASVLRPSALRGLSAYQNTFANESFVDELAAAAQADPVAFRLKHLKDDRAVAVIAAAARLAGWQPRAASGARTGDERAAGRGIAFCRYENDAAYAAVVAEVEVERASGMVRVTGLYAAHDCGLIINPDGVKNQVEGCLIQGMSRALFEEVALNRSGVTGLDWTGYPIARFEDIPARLEVELINRTEQPSVGAGEGATCPLAAAIANAIFDATGARLRQYPFTPQRVKAALASA
jgi:CO/xanthine dehydrogenase Mo-binding subunit